MASSSRSLFDNARREAVIILSLWLFSSLYSGTYCYLFGYKQHPVVKSPYGPTVSEVVGPLEAWDRTGDSLTFPASLGIPDWTFYGVAVPWAVCIVLTMLFCVFIFSEDDLADGDAAKEQTRQ